MNRYSRLYQGAVQIVMICALAAIGGCATSEKADKTARQVEREKVSLEVIANEASKQRPLVERQEAVIFHDGDWASLEPIEIKQREARTKLLCKGNTRVSYAPRVPVDILEFSQFLTNLCGVPIRVMPDAITAIQAQGRLSGGSSSGATSGAGAMMPPIPAIGQSIPATIGAGQPDISQAIGGRSGLINIKYDGDLAGLLDMVTNRLGVSWKVAQDSVSIFYIDTRTFRLFSQPYGYDNSTAVMSGTTMTNGASGGGAGSGIGGTSGSTQSTTIKMKSERWDDVDKSIKQMLTPGVGRGQGSPSTGTYTVTDIPEVLERIGLYLEDENESLTKQITFNVKVLSVTLTDTNSLGIDWTLIYKSLNGNWGLNLTNVTPKDPAAILGSASVLTNATGSAARFAGTTAVISALAQQGRVSELMSPTVTTLNHHTVPVQIGSQVSYIAQAQTTATAQVGSTTSLIPGSVTTGFNMRLTPYVMPNQQMLLDTALNVSALLRIRSVTSGGTTIEVPEVENRIFSQTAKLHPGETLILSGFEQISNSSNKSGVGDPSNIIFGGSVSSAMNRSVVVILITPYLMD